MGNDWLPWGQPLQDEGTMVPKLELPYGLSARGAVGDSQDQSQRPSDDEDMMGEDQSEDEDKMETCFVCNQVAGETCFLQVGKECVVIAAYDSDDRPLCTKCLSHGRKMVGARCATTLAAAIKNPGARVRFTTALAVVSTICADGGAAPQNSKLKHWHTN